jgi:uroporphyrinogen-III decarboxylase
MTDSTNATTMNSRALMRAAMRRQPTPRIPTMPQTLRDMAVHVYGAENGRDWIAETKLCLEDPAYGQRLLLRLTREVGCDGLRLHVLPGPLTIKRDGEDLIVLDARNGERVGRIDMHGGGGVIADHPEEPIETLAEAKSRIERILPPFSDEQITQLKSVRDSVSDLFVATPPGGITMNTYTILRSREQAMMDLYDRPDFVSAVMDMQADAIIRRAEGLLKAGVDAFYIGDPAASASLISPKHFEQLCVPAYQKFCRHFRNSDILIYIHVCGNSSPILEMMADTGAHVVEPLDPLGGVSVADAKRRIGGRVALMGGVNTLTLATGTAEDVRAEAIQKCREGGPYGYVLAAGDMVPPRTPLANLQALVDVATKSLWRA